MWTPCLVSSTSASGQVTVRVGHELVDDYLHFLSGRSRPNSVLAAGYDLKVFFAWCTKEPAEVRSRDVVNFVAAQRAPRAGTKVVRLNDGGAGLSTRTVARRLSSLSGFYAYLLARGDAGVTTTPVPRGLETRRGRRNNGRAAPLVRTPKLLPRILDPAAVNQLIAALRTARDRAMVEAMVLGGLRRCEVLGLRLEDLRVGQRRVFIAEGKGGHERSSRCRRASSPPWPPTSTASVRCRSTPIGSSWSAKAGPGAGRSARPGSTRSWSRPGDGPGCPTPPATSCATPA